MFQHQAPVVFLGVCVCLLLCLTANNGERYDESVNQNFQQIPVDRVDLGLPDTTAYVGKIFEISFKNQPVFGDDDVKLKVRILYLFRIKHLTKLRYTNTN